VSPRPPRLSLNLLASLTGSAWSALLNLALVPAYIALLGQEGYGLVGFYLSLQAVLQVLDLGLSPLLSREFARLDPADPVAGRDARDLLRTIESVYWGLGLAIAAILIALAPWIADQWLNPAALTRETVVTGVRLMGVLFAVQWPLSVYQSGLIGRERLISLNTIQIGLGSLAALGALGALIWIAPTPAVYFGWQIGINVLRVPVLALVLWRSLPGTEPARLRGETVRRRLQFAAAMTGVAATGLLLTQLDRLIVSWLLPLADLGLYSVAVLTTTGLGLIAGALFNAFYPRLTGAAASPAGADAIFQLYAQAVAVLVGVPALALVCFAPEIFGLWLGDPQRAAGVAAPAAWLALGSGLNALMSPWYALQLAHNRAGLALRLNVVLVAVAAPALLVLTPTYGLTGAAAVWPLTQGLYLLLGAPLSAARLMPNGLWAWAWRAVLRPLGAAGLVLGGLRVAWTGGAGSTVWVLGVCVCISLLLATSTAPALWERLRMSGRRQI
jgi:O-antigen/teichoic acid export membrane protein